jgi:hypothetical protein
VIIKKSIFLILLLAFVFFNCSDEPTSIGDKIPGLGLINLISINSNDDSIAQTSLHFHPEDVSLGSSERLLLGKTENINASILIKFETSLPDSIKKDILNDSITVLSDTMVLRQTYSFGEGSANFDFNVHKVLNNWSVDFSEDSLPFLQIDETQNLIVDKEINDSVTSVILSNQLIQDWLHITADTNLSGNYGIYFKPTENAQKVLGYQALTSSFTDIPIIKVVIQKPGAYVDTITFISTLDLTVMQGSVPTVSSGNIPIRAGYIVNGKVFFDLSSVPEKAVVNKAELVLTVDTLESKVGSSYTNSLQAYFLFDSTNTDSISSSSVTLSRSGNTFSGSVTTYVRAWLENNNHGLILKPGSPTTGVELFVIKGSDAFADKPLLKITYSIRE